MNSSKPKDKSPRHAVIPVRMLTEVARKITAAAERAGTSRSAFMREASERAAQRVLRKLDGERLSSAA